MAEIKRTVLFGKLNQIGYKSLESATVFCKLRGNPCVEVVHWIQQILQLPDSDFSRIVNHYELNISKLSADITASLDKLPLGASSLSALSSHLDDILENAWLYATLLFGKSNIRTGYLLISILKSKTLINVLTDISSEFSKIKVEALTDEYSSIVNGSVEDTLERDDGQLLITGGGAPGEASGSMAPATMGKQQALAQYSVDLTEKARKGEMDPILGRDEEIRQIMDILMRRRQNNPILTGEAGVGKTAVVEGFAQKIANGDVPPDLKEVSLRTLDIGLLQAGASMKGEFENRLRQVIEEVQSSPTPIILFIDEAHTLIGAGGAAGTGDAANLLKPALARGTLRTVAATTWAEYKKYFEKDPALTRRFQVVKIEEPSEENAILMLRGLAPTLEKHHKILILDEAIDAAVSLSHRYIAGRQLPDKAISLLDTASARVAISQHAIPSEIEATRRKIENFNTELAVINREQSFGFDHDKRKFLIQEQYELEKSRLTELEQNWEKEKEIVNEILACRQSIREAGLELDKTDAMEDQKKDAVTESSDPHFPLEQNPFSEEVSEENNDETLSQLIHLQRQLADLQGEHPLILNSVDTTAVGSVVADWTGIPVGGMVKDEISAILNLSDTLEERVIGQRHALDAISKRIQTSRAGVDNPNRPIGVFLLAGPSGVGKTETALALSEAMYGGEHNLITINMSEFQEAHTVSTLKGAPPGYVGYGEGGIMTEAVRRHPYSVVLLDEVEKAHPDVHEIFFQVFDKGQMEDGEGRMINFKNTIILLTSNVGSDLIMNMCKDPELLPTSEGIAKALREPLLKVFPAALLGRLVTIPYFPINDDMLEMIITLQLNKIKDRLLQNREIQFSYDDGVVTLIKSRCTEVESGARMVDAILTNTLLPEISTAYLSKIVEGGEIKEVRVGVRDEDFTYDII